MKSKKISCVDRIEWYLPNGKLHREDGPAIEWNDGDKEWFINGNRHREDGPAVIYHNGTADWYLIDVEYTKREWEQEIIKINLEKLMKK